MSKAKELIKLIEDKLEKEFFKRFAAEIALEKGLFIGYSPHDSYWYIGGKEELEKLGYLNIQKPKG